jgi:hypothetical protein
MSRAGTRTLQRSSREIASEAVELSAIKHTRNNGEAVFHVMRFTVPHNGVLSGRAIGLQSNAAVSRSAPTRSYDWLQQ